MKYVLQVLTSLALVAGIWLAGEAAWTVRVTRPHLEVTLENLDRTIIIAGAAATHLEKASGEWQSASKIQAQQTTAAMTSLRDTAAQLSRFVTRTDSSLNAVLFPEISEELKRQSDSLLKSQEGLQEGLLRISSATSQAQKVLADADAQITSPDIQKTLDNVAASSQNLAKATADGAATMKDVRVAVDKEVQTLLAPVNKAKMIVLFTAQLIGRLYGF